MMVMPYYSPVRLSLFVTSGGLYNKFRMGVSPAADGGDTEVFHGRVHIFPAFVKYYGHRQKTKEGNP